DKDTGELLWRKRLQGPVTQSTRGIVVGDTFDELWRKEIHKEGPGFYGDHIRQIVIDENSNIYMSGKYANSSNSLEYFGDYLLPQSIGTYNSGHTPFILKMNSEGVIQWV